MALIDKSEMEANLAAQHRKAAKFRTNHVGTKLNEAELREFDALAEKRQQSPSELIRGLVLREIEQDKRPAPELRGSAELEEITAMRLLLINVLPKLAVGDTPGVMIHESVHAGEAQKNPAQFNKDAKAERGQPHDSRPQEQRANGVRAANEKQIKQQIKQIEKDRKKDQQ
jgi:hypothetical protein